MFAESGTSTILRRSATGLGEYSMQGDTTSATTTSTNTSQYTPWWSGAGARRTVDTEMPISNVIGRIRFVPEPRTKSILVLSPPEYIAEIEKLIEKLDKPGRQVMIKAVIVEVDHKNLSSLGVQVATNPASFGTLDENSMTALNTLTQLDRHGSLVFGAGGNQGTQVTNTLTADVSVLIDFLVKKVNAKVLNQQTLWTEDNEEASFFKGQNVAFYTAATTGTGTSTQNFEFQRVGMNLAVRPSITPNKDVDMIINIIISQLTSDLANNQPVRTEMETKTNMIVGDSQTIMLGGILFQEESVVKRGIPGLSDIPILGGLFSHKENKIANNEMLVFITPYVIDEPDKTSPETKEEIERPKQKLGEIRNQLDSAMESLNK
jgi:general secretion pathway protein D